MLHASFQTVTKVHDLRAQLWAPLNSRDYQNSESTSVLLVGCLPGDAEKVVRQPELGEGVRSRQEALIRHATGEKPRAAGGDGLRGARRRGPYWAAFQVAAAVRTHPIREVLGASRAPGALEAADECIRRVEPEFAVAAFAIGSHLEHRNSPFGSGAGAYRLRCRIYPASSHQRR